MNAKIKTLSASLMQTPLHQPFVTSQGRAEVAQCVVVSLTLDNGREVWGEATPVAYVTQETPETVCAAVERVSPHLIGEEVRGYRTLWEILSATLPHEPSARCALEMATLNAYVALQGFSLPQLFGGAQESVESDITIPIVPNAEELAELAWGLGISVFKIKVGAADLEEDVARVLSVQRVAPEARIRVDANQAFTPETALAFVERLLAVGVKLELLEQPVPKEDFAGLGRVAERCPVPVFADESVRTPADALRLACETQVQGFNCKINKSGIAGVLDIIAIARAANRRLMLGCMLETRRSIAVSLALACGTGAFEFVDLDSHLLLREPGENPHFSQDGSILKLLA
jgi:L-alanine-DL-glutamate epimerase-like enolase superfamily enzyme